MRVILGTGLLVARWFFLAHRVSSGDGLLFPGLVLVASGLAFFIDSYVKRRRKP